MQVIVFKRVVRQMVLIMESIPKQSTLPEKISSSDTYIHCFGDSRYVNNVILHHFFSFLLSYYDVIGNSLHSK